MTVKYNACITFDATSNHKDSKNAKNLVFRDTYTINKDSFYDDESIVQYIKHDLALVAGGGYDTKNIENVKFNIQGV